MQTDSIEARTIEHACADVWPALEDVALGDWRLRAAGGFTGRANAALTCGTPGVPLEVALEHVRAFYTERGLPPKLQVVADTEVETGLRAADWRPDETHCGEAGVAVLHGDLDTAPSSGGRIFSHPPESWWQLVLGRSTPTPSQRAVLTGYTPAGYGSLEHEGRTAAAVRGAVHGELLHIARLAVLPELRRRGLAGALLGALFDWGAALGARRCVLQVDTANTGALRLYEGLGARVHHRYRYWIPAAG